MNLHFSLAARMWLSLVLAAALLLGAPAAALAGPATAVAVAVPAAATGVSFLPLVAPQTAGIAPWVANPLLLGTHIPLYWLDPGRAGVYSAVGLALPAAGVGLMFASQNTPVLGEWSMTFLQTYANLMRFSAFDIWVTERSALPVGDPLHLASDNPLVSSGRLARLASAPFGRTITDPLVWIPSLVAPAILTAYYRIAEYDGAVSVGTGGSAWIGATEVHPAAAGLYNLGKGAVDMLAVAVGEEAYYRGLVYDRIQHEYGRTVARVTDGILFPLVHLPADVQAGFELPTILFNAAWRAAMTFVFDAAYDKGGLPLSISVHFWSDLVLHMSRWYFYGGTPPA